MIRAALYLRVSTDEQAERGYGLAAQLSDLRQRATERRYHVPPGAEFIDDGYSGADLQRPALTRLRDAIRAGSFNVVLIHDPDRLARKLALQLLLLEEFEARARVEFVTTEHADTSDGRLLRNIRGAISEFEREKIRDRMARGRRERLKTGRVVFSVAPFGYRLDGERRERLVADEDEASTVRMMFGWLVQEQRSLRSIAGELQRLGVPTRHGAKWRLSTVRKIIASPLYTGRATFHAAGERVDLAVPSLVAPHVWDAAQAQLRRNVETRRGRPATKFYLLTSLVRCGLCGRRMSGMGGSGRYYECTNRDRVIGSGCRGRTHRARLDEMVWNTVYSILRDPDALAARFEDRQRRLGAQHVEVRSEVEHLRKQLSEVDRREERLLALWLDPDIPDAGKSGVKAKLAEIGGQRRALRERLATRESTAAGVDADRVRQHAIREWCELARRGLDNLTPEGKQRLLRSCVDAVVIRGSAVEIQGILPGRTGTWTTPENVHTATAP